jgi:ferredoxin
MGCTLCTRIYPALFAMKGKKVTVQVHYTLDMQLLQKVADACPVKAIKYIEPEDSSI